MGIYGNKYSLPGVWRWGSPYRLKNGQPEARMGLLDPQRTASRERPMHRLLDLLKGGVPIFLPKGIFRYRFFRRRLTGPGILDESPAAFLNQREYIEQNVALSAGARGRLEGSDVVINTRRILSTLARVVKTEGISIATQATFTPCPSLLEHIELQELTSVRQRDPFVCAYRDALYPWDDKEDLHDRKKFSLEGCEMYRIPLFSALSDIDCYVGTGSGLDDDLTPTTALPTAFVVRRQGESFYELLLLDTVSDHTRWLKDVKNLDAVLFHLQKKLLQSLFNSDDNIHEVAAMQIWGVVHGFPGHGEELLPQIQSFSSWMEEVVRDAQN